MNRESWLQSVVEQLDTWPEFTGRKDTVRVGVGFTSKGARSSRIGECWSPTCSKDKVVEIFIHPKLHDTVEVSATLAHELVHATVGVECKHGPKFKKVALAIGLTGKMTATVPGQDFKDRIAPVLEAVGPYPHAALVAGGMRSTGPKQTTRMIKCECPVCGYLVRTSQRWLDVALPVCPVDECELGVGGS